MSPARSYIFEGGVLNLFSNTAAIAGKFFVPLWLIAVTFVLPVCLLFDFAGWLTGSPITFTTLVGSPIIWIATYFASFVIAGEVSEICLGGTASLSKAMYKTSVRGVGRLLGTDILVGLVVLAFYTGSALLSLLVAILTNHPIAILTGSAIGFMGAAFII